MPDGGSKSGSCSRYANHANEELFSNCFANLTSYTSSLQHSSASSKPIDKKIFKNETEGRDSWRDGL